MGVDAPTAGLIELGCQHEQQHQELLLMDIKHVLSQHPAPSAYATRDGATAPAATRAVAPIELAGGAVEVGHDGVGFCFDNELPRHLEQVGACAVGSRLVSCGEYLEFMADGGYERPELWLYEGWAVQRENGWHAPLYWTEDEGRWRRYTLFGTEDVADADPVTHVSYYEADAFARWRGARLPTEAEWELACGDAPPSAPFALEPPAVGAGEGFFGSVWQWTQSAYAPYPGFHPSAGAVGEYNGKFMVNQQVLRGSASITPPGHARATYRNFFHASSRWPFTGLRLAWDAS
jgi:ergothioneine biosynthesis protein EgtB